MNDTNDGYWAQIETIIEGMHPNIDQGIRDVARAMADIYAVDARYDSIFDALADFGIVDEDIFISFVEKVAMPMAQAVNQVEKIPPELTLASTWIDALVIGMLAGRAVTQRKGTDALQKIASLQERWDAPVSHERGDLGEAAWAAVGSEAVKTARDALNGKAS